MKRILSFDLLIAALLLAIPATAAPPQPNSQVKTILYFVRHAEDTPELDEFDPSISIQYNNCVEDEEGDVCCEEVLNPLGQARAAALAAWFDNKGLTRDLTHVIASHKIRTRQTVQRIALAAGLGGDLNGDLIPDGTDVDQESGDGVINVPAFPMECDEGFTSSSSALGPQAEYLKTLPLGSRAVVCTHSPVMYPLMETFGIDTSDPVKFPKNSRGRVSGFNNLWVVELEPVETAEGPSYHGRVLAHVIFDLQLDVANFDLTPGKN